MTAKAVRALENVPVIIGHKDCLDLTEEVIAGKETIAEGLTPVKRAGIAVAQALTGKDVAIVTTGAPGIYAIASTFFNYLMGKGIRVPVEVIPGVTMANAAAALLGSPLGNDFAVISLADWPNPWSDTKRRLESAAETGFVVEASTSVNALGETLRCHISAQKTILIVGNSKAFVFDARMITPREYKKGVGY